MSHRNLSFVSPDFSLNERQVLEISDVWSREHTWLVAFLPRHCFDCDKLLHEMRIVSKRVSFPW